MLELHKDYWLGIFEDYWGLGDDEPPEYLTKEEWARARHDDEIAKRILRTGLALDARHMLPGKQLPDMTPAVLDFVRSMVSSYAEFHLVRDGFSFELADQSLSGLEHAPDRLRNLLGLVLSGQYDDRTAAFLARAGRLYVFGYEAEALVMCRAALDVAMQERFPDDVMQTIPDIERKRLYSLDERIFAALKQRVFTREQKAKADRLRRAGNHAVHVAPGFLVEGVDDALSAIRILAELLVALFHVENDDV